MYTEVDASLDRSAEPQILLVEDNLVNQEVVVDMLDQVYHVSIVNNGKEAVTASQQQSYSLILMDCEMPEMDGFAATEAIRLNEKLENRTAVPIIAVTAHAIRSARDKCLVSGMDDFLSKPFNFNDLHAIVEKWIKSGPIRACGSDTPVALLDPVASTVKSTVSAPSQPRSEPAIKPQAPIIDRRVIERLRQTERRKKRSVDISSVKNSSLVERVIGIYLQQTPGLLTDLSLAIAQNNIAQVVEIAHSLKSSSAAVGAMALSNGYREIEQQGRNGLAGLQELEQKVIQINHKYQLVEDCLKEILDSES